nr:helix-turn-helix transcriptional regulator [uncultured Fluviicola sp.]
MEDFEFVKIIGDNIISRRTELGIKQIDLATSIGIEDSALRRIEKGKTNPTAKTLLKIAIALNTEVSELVSMKK